MFSSDFYFLGKAPLSKSLLNRALIIKSWVPEFIIHGTSQCDDIDIMTKAIHNLKNKKEFNCGLSGTAFRFLTTRMSRETGEFFFTGDRALLKRPLAEISLFLSQLSVDVKQIDKGFLISSEGWMPIGDSINVPSQNTSQYASALVLNSWNLKRDLYFCLSKESVSYPYFKMTLDFVKELGLIVKENGREFFIPKNQMLKKFSYTPEQDKSCLFALACFSSFNGRSIFLDWELESLQPDKIFPEILKKMGVNVNFKEKELHISNCENLKSISLDLKACPDLFPLLAVLCAKAEGISEFTGLSHLIFKESNRLEKTKELIDACGIKIEIKGENCLIYGKKTWPIRPAFIFETAQDHRMVMAGELVSFLGLPITVKGKRFVNKSFPEFYSLIGL